MEEGSITNRLSKRTQEFPLYPVGIVGFVAVAAYGFFRFKNRKGKTSLYLIQLRLAAQGTTVGIIGIGILYNIYSEMTKPKVKD